MEVKRLQQELSEAHTEIGLLKQDLQAARDEIDRLEVVNSNLMAFTAQASAKSPDESLLSELELQIADLKIQKETLENNLSQLTTINHTLQSELQTYKIDNETLRCSIDDLGRRLQGYSTGGMGSSLQLADDASSLRAQIAKLEQTLKEYRSSSSGYSVWEEKYYQAESRITELEVLLAGAEKYANQYQEAQRLLENARAELARQISTTGQSPRELEDLLSEYKVKLSSANEHNKRISEQYEKLLEIRNKQDERLRKMGDLQHQNESLTLNLNIVNAELTKLRLKEKEYSQILSSVDSHNLRNDERIRELEQRHRLELSRREEIIAGLREEKSRLIELTHTQKANLQAINATEQLQFIRGLGNFDASTGGSRPVSAQLGSLGASRVNASPAIDDTLGYQALNTSRHHSRPSTALKATMQLRLASQMLKNVMN